MSEPLCAICGLDHDRADAQDWAAHLNSRAQANLERAVKAEADAALAWRRVTELQERGTQLVEERRAANERFEGLLTRLRDFVDDADNRAIPTYRILQLLDAFIFDEVRP